MKLANLDDDDDKAWLSKGWDDVEGEHVQSYVESVGVKVMWTANQVCCGPFFFFGGGADRVGDGLMNRAAPARVRVEEGMECGLTMV